jgi:hypothetical protein
MAKDSAAPCRICQTSFVSPAEMGDLPTNYDKSDAAILPLADFVVDLKSTKVFWLVKSSGFHGR